MTATHPNTRTAAAVTVTSHVDGHLLDETWNVYRESFAPLAHLAAQRHPLTEAEFQAVMHDRTVDKYLAHDRSGLAGVAAITRDLHSPSLTLISPAYYQTHWPHHYAKQHIWYVLFLAVAPDAQNSGVFHALEAALHEEPTRRGGIVGLDICAHNDKRGFPELIADAAGVPAQRVDAQIYVVYEFPEPTP